MNNNMGWGFNTDNELSPIQKGFRRFVLIFAGIATVGVFGPIILDKIKGSPQRPGHTSTSQPSAVPKGP